MRTERLPQNITKVKKYAKMSLKHAYFALFFQNGHTFPYTGSNLLFAVNK